MQARRAMMMAVGLVWCAASISGCMDEAVARAGPDQTVEAGVTVTLDGSASTPKRRGALNYAWKVQEGPEVTFSDDRGRTTTFEAPRQGTETAFFFRLKVTYVDYLGRPVPSNSDTDDVMVRVRADQDLVGQEPAADEPAADNGVANENAAPGEGDTTSPDATTDGTSVEDLSTAGGPAAQKRE